MERLHGCYRCQWKLFFDERSLCRPSAGTIRPVRFTNVCISAGSRSVSLGFLSFRKSGQLSGSSCDCVRYNRPPRMFHVLCDIETEIWLSMRWNKAIRHRDIASVSAAARAYNQSLINLQASHHNLSLCVQWNGVKTHECFWGRNSPEICWSTDAFCSCKSAAPIWAKIIWDFKWIFQ